MKSMLLTGLGSEQDFETGGTGYFLIFNGGELRVPISEKAAETVVNEMYGKPDNSPASEAQEEPQEQPFYQSEDTSHNNDSEFDDGVDQI